MTGQPATARGGADYRAPFVLALDIGTSSTRAIVFDRDGYAIPGAQGRRTYRLRTSNDGGVEGDADTLVRLTIETIDEALRQAGPHATAIGAVGISCFWHSLLGLDADGAALTPVYSWADTRSAAAADALAAELDPEVVHSRTGCVLHTSYWPAKLRWLTGSQTDLSRRVARWVGFAEYFLLRLCGSAVCGVSMASGTGLLNQHTASWDAPLLAHLGLRPDQAPPLAVSDREGYHLLPDFARRWPALAGASWYPAYGDGACNNVGSGCVTPDRLALSIGTSGVMRIVVPGHAIAIPPRLWCYRIDRRRFVLGGALSNAGNVTDWLRATTQLPSDAATAVAALPPDRHGLTILPFLAGERTPDWRPRARAAFVGLSLDTTPVELLRATLEAVAHRFALVHELLCPLANEPYEIICSGGGVEHWPVWPQIIADALGKRLTASSDLEASARGAALLALEASGAIPDLAAVPTPLGQVYEPDRANHLVYRQARARLERLNATLGSAFEYEREIEPTLASPRS